MLQSSDITTLVAAAGVVGAIAIPNFKKFQQRSRRSEAKVNLKALLVAQMSYHAETGRYCPTFAECAFSIEPGATYLYFMGPNEAQGGDAADSPDLLRMQAAMVLDQLGIEPGVHAQGFRAVAIANLDRDQDLDVWMIDESNNLVNLVNDLD